MFNGAVTTSHLDAKIYIHITSSSSTSLKEAVADEGERNKNGWNNSSDDDDEEEGGYDDY